MLADVVVVETGGILILAAVEIEVGQKQARLDEEAARIETVVRAVVVEGRG